MTAPRPIEPNTTFFVTVCAVNHMFRFVPTKDVRESIDYLFKAIATEFEGKIAIHEYQFLSNHFHILGTDITGCLPAFMRKLNRAISAQLNAIRGLRGGNIEKGYNLCVVDMLTGRKAFEKAVYVLTQAVKAHLVERTREWKAPSSYALEYGEAVTSCRPPCGLWSDKMAHVNRPASIRSGRASFGGYSTMPPEVTFKLVRLPILPELDDCELREQVRAAVRIVEDALVDARRHAGRQVAGWNRVVSRHFNELPSGKHEYFARTPTFIADNPQRHALFVAARRKFLAEYQKAYDAFRAGLSGVVFPAGTWLMRVIHKLPCKPFNGTLEALPASA